MPVRVDLRLPPIAAGGARWPHCSRSDPYHPSQRSAASHPLCVLIPGAGGGWRVGQGARNCASSGASAHGGRAQARFRLSVSRRALALARPNIASLDRNTNLPGW